MILEPTKANLAFIKLAINQGNIIIFPTDTVYGIGCIATNPKAVERIYKLKNRDEKKSLLLNVHNISAIKKIAIVNERDTKLIKQFMPGPLSLILKCRHHNFLSPQIKQTGKIGVRIPNNEILLQLLKKLKNPLVSTSCNISGSAPCLTAKEAEKIFGEKVLILDSKEPLSGKASTIIDTSEQEIKYIRSGDIPFAEIKKFIKKQKENKLF